MEGAEIDTVTHLCDAGAETDALARLCDALRAYGATLVVDGLKSRPELNKRNCVIVRGLVDGRVTICGEAIGKPITVRPENVFTNWGTDPKVLQLEQLGPPAAAAAPICACCEAGQSWFSLAERAELGKAGHIKGKKAALPPINPHGPTLTSDDASVGLGEHGVQCNNFRYKCSHCDDWHDDTDIGAIETPAPTALKR
jgi:hypothetical protein